MKIEHYDTTRRKIQMQQASRERLGLRTPLRRHTPLLTALLRLLSTECLGAGDVAGIHLRGDAGRKVQQLHRITVV